jgi:WAS protein family, member 3
MPLVKRTVEPVHICRGEAVGVVRDELKYFNVTSLANVIRQLGSLSAHVDDIFNELCRDAISITRRTMALSERAERLKIKITQLNPTVEEGLFMQSVVFFGS